MQKIVQKFEPIKMGYTSFWPLVLFFLFDLTFYYISVELYFFEICIGITRFGIARGLSKYANVFFTVYVGFLCVGGNRADQFDHWLFGMDGELKTNWHLQ